MEGGLLGVWRPIVRALLIALVIPPLFVDVDLREAVARIARFLEQYRKRHAA